MPRTYVDNAYNRANGRVGMTLGTAVISSSGGSGGSYGGGGYSSYSSSSGGSGRTYVDNAMNRSLGRVGLSHGSAVHSSSGNSSSYSNSSGGGTYVDNSMNRSLGRVGLPLGSAVHSTSGNSSSSKSSVGGSSGRTYVDNEMNRSLGRVGLPHGSAVHSSSSQSGHSITGGRGSTSNNAARAYADNAYNRRLGRVGLPLGTAVVSKSTQSGSVMGSSSASAPRRYVDNPTNRRLGRVGMIVGTMPVSSRPTASRKEHVGVDEIFRPLVRLDPEDDNLGDIMNELVQLRNEVRTLRGNPDRELQCEQAIGIVNRHEAALTKYQNKLKVPDWVRGGQVIPFENLELGEKIGGGGFGDVHTAFWNGNVVAVKKLRVQRVSQAKKEEFQAEVKVFSEQNHPAIVKFFGVCITSPNLAIVMEFMGGGSMHDILHIEQRVLTETQKKQMITDCLEALKYLHAKNVTHRDIKSMNIMICDDYEHCKLGDFGLALKEDARASSSVVDHGAVGTLPYSPPEVIEGRRLKLDELKCVDVYSMGIVMVEFLTKKPPFKGLNQHQIRQSIRNGLRPNTESISDASLKTLLEMAMSQEVERRPSARMFLRKWEELKLIGSMNRLSIVDVNASNTAGSSGRTGGLPSYLADILNTSAIRSSSSGNHSSSSTRNTRNSSSSSRRLNCPVCLESSVNTAFGCGHLVCGSCLPNLTSCPQCRGSVQNPIRIFV